MKDSGWKIILGTVIAGLLLFGWLNIVMASSVGPRDCTGVGTAQVPEDLWTNNSWEAIIGDACLNDGDYTHVSSNLYDNGDRSYVLYVRNFGFSVSGEIVGVTVDLNTWSSSASHEIDLCQLTNGAGARVGTNLCSGTPVTIDSSLNTNVETLGGTSELWGNALTDTWVNNVLFGVAIGILNHNNNSNVFIDYIQITVETSDGEVTRRRLL